jgi:hypothetical protein
MAHNNGTSNHDQHDDHDDRTDPRGARSTDAHGQGQSGYMAGRPDPRGFEGTGRNRPYPYERTDDRYTSGVDRPISGSSHDRDAHAWEEPGYGDRGYNDQGYGGQGYGNQGFGSAGAANQGSFGGNYHNTGYAYPRPRPMAHPMDRDTGYDRDRELALRGGHRGKLPMNFAHSDERLREKICEMLADHDLIDPSNVDVKVKDGDVTITGSIEDRHQRRLIDDMVTNVPGVQDVHMSLKIAKPDAKHAEPNGSTTTPNDKKARA